MEVIAHDTFERSFQVLSSDLFVILLIEMYEQERLVVIYQKGSMYLVSAHSQTCLSDPLCITTSFVSRPYLFLPSVFPCIRPLYNDPLSNATNDRVLWVKILHITTIRRLLSNRKLDNK